MNVPAHDLAAPDVDHQVEKVELAPYGASEVGDIPGPHPIRPAGHVLPGPLVTARLGLAAVGKQLLLSQDPIEGCLRGDVSAFLSQNWNDLGGRQIAKPLAVG